MSKERTPNEQVNKAEQRPFSVRLPGFLAEEDIGLGDVLKRATSAVGISPCNSCAQRARLLNGWVVFSGRRSR